MMSSWTTRLMMPIVQLLTTTDLVVSYVKKSLTQLTIILRSALGRGLPAVLFWTIRPSVCQKNKNAYQIPLQSLSNPLTVPVCLRSPKFLQSGIFPFGIPCPETLILTDIPISHERHLFSSLCPFTVSLLSVSLWLCLSNSFVSLFLSPPSSIFSSSSFPI